MKIRGQFGRKIFQAVDGQIDAALGQRLFDFLGEHALGANLGERDIGDFVAGGLDDFELDFVARARKIGMWLACQSASCEPREPMRRRATQSVLSRRRTLHASSAAFLLQVE